MPTRKQRRRRDKTFRHEYDLVTYDEEGNEVSVDRAELRPEKPKAPKPGAKAPARGGRSLREPPKPSWRRSVKRGGVWGLLMLVVVVGLFRTGSIVSRVAIGVLYAAAFIPLTFWIDRLAYRNLEKRSGKSGRA
jgi:hypothetical protein